MFYDTGLCKNGDFALALYTPYKSVAYEVWRLVSQKQPPPQPNYQQAQQTRVTVGVTPVRGSTNAFTDLVLKRGGRTVAPVSTNEYGRRRPIHLRLSGVCRHRQRDARAGWQDQNHFVPHRATGARPIPLMIRILKDGMTADDRPCAVKRGHYVYIVRCVDGTLYTGYARDPQAREIGPQQRAWRQVHLRAAGR